MLLLTSKELKEKNIEIRADKMFALKPDFKKDNIGTTLELGAFITKKSVTLKTSIDILDLPVFSKIYSDFKEVEKEVMAKTKDIKLAIIRKRMLESNKYDNLETGYIEMLCNGKALNDFKLFKTTLYKARLTIENDGLTMDIVQVEYAENGMVKSTLVIDTFKTNTLAFRLTDCKDKNIDIFIDLEKSIRHFKNTDGLKETLKKLPNELEQLPIKIKDDLVKFIEMQNKTKVDNIQAEYSEIFE